MDKIWIVKRLRDLRSGKPETDVHLFLTELTARTYIARVHGDFEAWDWDPNEDEHPTIWALGDPDHPDEFLELGWQPNPLAALVKLT